MCPDVERGQFGKVAGADQLAHKGKGHFERGDQGMRDVVAIDAIARARRLPPAIAQPIGCRP